MKKKIYMISNNPVNKKESLIDPVLLEDERGNVGFVTIPENCDQTGMYSDLEKLKEVMYESDIIFSLGDLDQVGYFELGIACALNKNVYIVSNNIHLNLVDLKIYVSASNIKFIDIDTFYTLL